MPALSTFARRAVDDPIHFIGIGGIGMSGIAEVLMTLGYEVQGSDASENANVKLLREHDATVFVGHEASNVGESAPWKAIGRRINL
jgi:UDP-N-acetylmuramate--alanine ligase